MTPLETTIIHKLSAKAAEPTAEFRDSLREQLVRREQTLHNNISPPRRGHSMKINKLLVGLAALVVLAGVPTYLLTRRDSPQGTGDTSQASSLSSEQVASLDEARKSLSFAPLRPSIRIGDESLGTIKVGTAGSPIDSSDTLYLTYTDNTGALYKISQSTKKFNYPSDVEVVTLNINGQQINASLYRLANAEEGSTGPNSAGSDVPSSYLFWSNNGVNYEISEFGRVSKQQLIELANSLR